MESAPRGPRPRRYAVVGASGILAPLGGLLAGPGAHTVGISRGRRPAAGTWTEQVTVDARDASAVASWRRAYRPWPDVVVGYAPALSPESWGVLTQDTLGAVLVVTSRWADPTVPQPDWSLSPSTALVVLGWAGPAGAARWHSPEEVSTAVHDALGGPPGARVVVGRLRPWADRPG